MEHNNKKYSWINEKTVDGIKYTIYRCDNDPRDVILVTGDEIKPFKVKDWSNL